jgi:hypothetical protein
MTSRRRDGTGADAVATLALLIAGSALAALGLAWWSDGAHRYEAPEWDAARFVELAPATGGSGERWVVAVNLRCPHCRQHLRSLAQRIARRQHPPRLAALIVDQNARPRHADLGVPLAGGAWWDSAQVWREAWGRRVYGETFRFDGRGRLLSATPVGTLPDSSRSRM